MKFNVFISRHVSVTNYWIFLDLLLRLNTHPISINLLLMFLGMLAVTFCHVNVKYLPTIFFSVPIITIIVMIITTYY